VGYQFQVSSKSFPQFRHSLMPTHIWTCNGNTVLKLFLRHVSENRTPTLPIDFNNYLRYTANNNLKLPHCDTNNTKYLHWKMSCSRRIALKSSQIMVYMFVYSFVLSAQCDQCVHLPTFSKFSRLCLPHWRAPRWLPHWWDEFLHNSEIKCTKQVSSDFFCGWHYIFMGQWLHLFH
jgi:hypothetical protein